MPKSDRHDAIKAAIRNRVPRAPGVYLFHDRYGRTIYIGKSVNLRQRMLSYFNADQARHENRIRQMVFSVDDFEFRETQTELLDLLLEDALIKRRTPPYNVRQQEYARYCYLHLTDDPYPTCKIVSHEGVAGGALFGPFRDGYLAADILAVVNQHIHLRSCADQAPFRRSLNFDLGFCTGPCRGNVSAADYAKIVERAREFLEGRDEWMAAKLREDMARSAERLEYEKAAELKAELAFCQDLCARQRFIADFRAGPVSLREEGDGGATYEFSRGSLLKISGTRDTEAQSGSIPEELLEQQTDPRWVLDRANLVYGWHRRRGMIGSAAP